MEYVMGRIDWSKRVGYIRDRHEVEAAWADEAVVDPDACWIDPDRLVPAGCRSG